MKLPSSPKKIKRENGARSEDEDSDVTLVTVIRNAKHIEENPKSQIKEEESESLLNGLKKKNKKHKRGSNEHNANTQSDLFPSRTLMPEFSEMVVESNVSHKRKKRKLHHEENIEPDNQKKNHRNSVEFLSQDIYSQSSSTKFYNSTPYTTPRKEKKKKKDREKFEEKENSNNTIGKTILINGEFISQNNMTSIFDGLASDNGKQNGFEKSSLNFNNSFNKNWNEQNISSKGTNINISSCSETTIIKKKKKKNSLSEDSKELSETPKKNKKKSKNANEAHISMDIDPGPHSLSPEFPKTMQKKNKGCISNVKEELDINKSTTSISGSPKKRKNSPTGNSESIENIKDELDIHEVKLVDLNQSLVVGAELMKYESQYLNGDNEENHYESDEGVENDENLVFKMMDFETDFAVPPLHKILDRASKPTEAQRDQIKSASIKVRQGKFTKAEDNQIKENWRHFIEVKNIEDNPEMFFCLNKKFIPKEAKRLFLYYLARDMPERTPYSVFRRFKLLMGRQKKGRFTEEEDEAILKVINNESRSQSYVKELAIQLKRSQMAIAYRIRALKNQHTRKIKWKGRNAATFIKYLLKVTGTTEENIQDLKDRPVTIREWTKLSKKLDGIPIRILQRVWLDKLHPALFITHRSLNLGEVRLKLVDMFIQNNETDWRNVNWSYYASQFPGLTYLRVYHLMKSLVNIHVPEHKRHNLKKSLKCLSKGNLVANIRHQVIRRIKYENGELLS